MLMMGSTVDLGVTDGSIVADVVHELGMSLGEPGERRSRLPGWHLLYQFFQQPEMPDRRFVFTQFTQHRR